jgi:dihydropteroate synthase
MTGPEVEPGDDTVVVGDVPMPRLMAVLNASPESFSGGVVDARTVVDTARRHLRDGASILDIGGQSLRTDEPELPVEVELERSVPLLRACRDAFGDAGPDLSVDTYRAPVAAAAIEAGATIVNDPSGLRDPDVVAVVRGADVRVVVTYNRATPKVRLSADELVEDPIADGVAALRERIDRLVDAGVSESQVLVDPGPDLGKSPAQTVAVLRSLDAFRSLGRPLLLALSRKDVIGATLRRPPEERAAGLDGILAALDLRADDVVRVHEPRSVRDFYVMRAVISGAVEVPDDLVLPVHLRHRRRD